MIPPAQVRSKLDLIHPLTPNHAQARSVKKIISHWMHQDLHSGWSAWVKAWELAKTDRVLADTIGSSVDDDVDALLRGMGAR